MMKGMSCNGHPSQDLLDHSVGYGTNLRLV